MKKLLVVLMCVLLASGIAFAHGKGKGGGHGKGHGYDNGPGCGPGNGNGYGHNKDKVGHNDPPSYDPPDTPEVPDVIDNGNTDLDFDSVDAIEVDREGLPIPTYCDTDWERATLPECCGLEYNLWLQDEELIGIDHAIHVRRIGGWAEKCGN